MMQCAHNVYGREYTVGRSLDKRPFFVSVVLARTAKEPPRLKGVMPRKRGERISKRKEHLTDFGELLQQLCEYLGCTDADIARVSGLSQAVISRGTRVSKEKTPRDPTRDTVTRIYAALEQFAHDKELPMTPELKDIFFNIAPALHATPEQAASAKRRMGMVYSMLEEARKHALENAGLSRENNQEIPPPEL